MHGQKVDMVIVPCGSAAKLRPQIVSDLQTNKAGATRLHDVQPSLIMEQNLQDCVTEPLNLYKIKYGCTR